MYYSDEYIEHHGVLGMKWGVRKDRSSGSGKHHIKKIRSTLKAIKNDRRTVYANRTAGEYVNSEIRKGTGSVGGKAVSAAAKSEIRRNKRVSKVTGTIRTAALTGLAAEGAGTLAGTLIYTTSAMATPVGALALAVGGSGALISHYMNNRKQDILERAISTIDDGDIATRVDRGLRDEDVRD